MVSAARGYGSEAAVAMTAILAILALAMAVRTLQSVERLNPAHRAALESVERRAAGWERRLAELERRRRLHGWMAREIRRANPGIGVEETRAYSGLVLEITEKYTSIDPLFLLAVGIVESHFEPEATSPADAKGLYQIWPATGRWLASELDWSFSEAMLYDPERNTELAALYLDKLFATYGDPRLVLAEYNGGPINARRFRSGSERLASETREYVVKVMRVLDGLHRRLNLAPEPIDDPHAAARVAWLEPLHRTEGIAD